MAVASYSANFNENNFNGASSGLDSNARVSPGDSNDSSYAQTGALYKGTNHMGRLVAYEPQRLYNFELQIVGLDALFTANNYGTAGGDTSNSNLIKFSSAAERILVACSSFSVPNTEFGMIEIPHYNNTTKYAGKVTFGDATLKIEQYLGSYTEQIITTWCRCVYDPKTQHIGYKNDYAKDMYVIQYDTKGGSPRVWKMENAWPAVLPGGDWDYNSTDRRQISLSIKCDRCVPDYGIDVVNASGTSFADNDVNKILKEGYTHSMSGNSSFKWDVATQSYVAK